MSTFIPDMIEEFVLFVKTSDTGTEKDFSKHTKNDFLQGVSFCHFEVPFCDIRYFVISWYDDDDTNKEYEHRASFYVHPENQSRTLGGVESALFSMLGRYSCDAYTHQIVNALYI